MSISQSTVVLRHFASQSVHHYILGHTPSPGALNLPQVLFTFDLVVDSESCIPGHTLLLRDHYTFHRFCSLFFFNLVVDPHELSYWGISPPVEFACIVILVSSAFESLDRSCIVLSV